MKFTHESFIGHRYILTWYALYYVRISAESTFITIRKRYRGFSLRCHKSLLNDWSSYYPRDNILRNMGSHCKILVNTGPHHGRIYGNKQYWQWYYNAVIGHRRIQEPLPI